MKLLRASDADRISNLPADVTELILLRLPTTDAAKTALLSRQWRHRWKGIPQLEFDQHFARIPEDGKYTPHVNKLLLRIHKALLLHDGPITKFLLKIPGLRPHRDIDHLIGYLPRKGIQDLSLHFGNEDDGYPHVGCKIPTCLFSATHLTNLSLAGCSFKAPSWFAGFSKLTGLDLGKVHLPSDFFKKFIPSCPLLQSLRIICFEANCNVELVAPCLKLFFFGSKFSNICFKDTPVLTEVLVCDVDYSNKQASFEGDNQGIVDLFASLPALSELVLGIDLLLFLAARDVPYKLPMDLHHLTVLAVDPISLRSLLEARVLVCLIMSSPNLIALSIKIDQIDDNDSWHPAEYFPSLRLLMEVEDIPATCFQCLEKFKMRSRGSRMELEIVKFVLATAPILREVEIELKWNSKNSKDIINFVKEVTQCECASKEADVIYI